MLGFLKRSLDVVKEGTVKAMAMDVGAWQKEMPMLQINTEEDLKNWVVGCDKDIGGFSDARLEFTEERKGRFSGNISLELPLDDPRIVQSGYAGVRSRARPASIFGRPTWDTVPFRYLAVRVRGDDRKYLVNIQTDGVVRTDLFQHRLFLRKPGQWEVVMIPFRDFILTNQGVVQEHQIRMLRERVRTVGFSILRQPGPFCLEIDYVKAMNTESTEGDFDRM